MWVYDYDCKKDVVCDVRWAAELCLLCEIHTKSSALWCDQGLHWAELPRGVSHWCHHVSYCNLTAGMSRGSPIYPHNVVTPKETHFNHTFKYMRAQYKIKTNPTALTQTCMGHKSLMLHWKICLHLIIIKP